MKKISNLKKKKIVRPRDTTAMKICLCLSSDINTVKSQNHYY
jgi:3-hydroxymyristoyl/3-hydroxydecanoyl-(acyl carrier protein) dehydratase